MKRFRLLDETDIDINIEKMNALEEQMDNVIRTLVDILEINKGVIDEQESKAMEVGIKRLRDKIIENLIFNLL